jgi:hypothetical protein
MHVRGRDQAAAVFFESDSRMPGEAFWVGIKGLQERSNLNSNLLVTRSRIVSHRLMHF